jgi:hypothetical protein
MLKHSEIEHWAKVMRNEKAMNAEGMQNGRARADQIISSGKIQEGEAGAYSIKEMQRSTSIQEEHGHSNLASNPVTKKLLSMGVHILLTVFLLFKGKQNVHPLKSNWSLVKEHHLDPFNEDGNHS